MSGAGWPVPVPPGDVTAAVSQPSPSPSPTTFSPLEVSPGLLGFVPVFLIALACVLLFLSLTKQLRRVKVRQAQLDAAEAAGAGRGEPGPDAGGTGDPGEPGSRERGPGPR